MLETRLNTKHLIVAVLFAAMIFAWTHLPQGAMPSLLQKDVIDRLEHILAYAVIVLLFLISLRAEATTLSMSF